MSTSRWRAAARRVIAETLAALPAGADERAKRVALRDAYPWGERKHHPYRAWCAEVKLALGQSGRRDRPATPAVRVGPRGVLCGWCHDHGCLTCGDAKRRWAAFAGDRAEWRRLLLAAREGADARGPYADWLAENGWDDEAALVLAGWDAIVADRQLSAGEGEGGGA